MDLWNPSAGIRNMKMQPNQTVATPMQADQSELSDECGKLTSENNSIKDELTRFFGPEAVSKLDAHLQS
ncbi:hypothetical protein Tco_0184470 [Tanacetum coccineum]